MLVEVAGSFVGGFEVVEDIVFAVRGDAGTGFDSTGGFGHMDMEVVAAEDVLVDTCADLWWQFEQGTLLVRFGSG